VVWAILCCCCLLVALLIYTIRVRKQARILDARCISRPTRPTANIVPIGLVVLAVGILLLCLFLCRLISYIFNEPFMELEQPPTSTEEKLQPNILAILSVLGMLLIFLLYRLRSCCHQRHARMPSRRGFRVVQRTPVQSHTQDLACTSSHIPSELHGEVTNWLNSAGMYKDIGKTASLVVLFAIYLLGTPEQVGRGSSSSFIICPYSLLSDIVALCSDCVRWGGKEVAVRRTEDWPFLRERLLCETSSMQPADFVLRPNGALHAVITPGHASRRGVSMREVGSKHSSVVVVDVHFVQSRSGYGQLLVHHNGRTWRSPKLKHWASAEADALAAARKVVVGERRASI